MPMLGLSSSSQLFELLKYLFYMTLGLRLLQKIFPFINNQFILITNLTCCVAFFLLRGTEFDYF